MMDARGAAIRAAAQGAHVRGQAMNAYHEDEDEGLPFDDPIEVAEAVLGSDARFVSERGDDGDLSFAFKAQWCEVSGFFCWREELPAMLMTVTFDLAAAPAQMADTARLIALINENLWLGHFDLWSEDGAVVFRHAVAMIGRSELAPGEVQAMLAAAMDAADRFFPAFDLLLRCKCAPEQAIEAALFETVGEA